jgi:chromosome segregation ATPase
MDLETTERFDGVDRRLDAVDRRFDAVDRRFDAVDRRFDAMDQRFDAMDRRFDTMDQRFDAMDHRLDSMDQRFDATDRKIDEKFEESKRYFGVLVERFESMIALIVEGQHSLERQLREFRVWTETAVGTLDQRVMRLESRCPRGGSVTEIVRRARRGRCGARSSRGRSAAS